MNVKLQGVLRALKSLALDPGTNMALNGLTGTVGILNPFLRYEGPFVTVCNNWNYFWTELADVVSEGTTFGDAQRTLLNFANHQTNNVGSQGATAPANGYLNNPADQAAKLQSGGADAEYAHGPTYAASVSPQGAADCEAGQRGYPVMLNHLDPKQRRLESDAHTPGNQGMNWTGLTHVPPGETFTREPSGGPQLPNIPGNN
jgi:hypothetical protein